MRGGSLERSCKDWLAAGEASGGVQRLRAWFAGAGFARHRHDIYAVGLTETGVQRFWYRGAVHTSMPGEVVVLHPDEAHDGYAGTAEGFGYRILYIDPARVAEAARAIAGRACALPFVPRPVVKSSRLRAAIDAAFAATSDAEETALQVTEALLGAATVVATSRNRIDDRALERVRQLLEAAEQRPVHTLELQAASGLSRFELARQFRSRFGTSPYRYGLLRRLEWARAELAVRPIVEVALDAGFADQAHFTRAFKAAFGMTPAAYYAARERGRSPSACFR